MYIRKSVCLSFLFSSFLNFWNSRDFSVTKIFHPYVWNINIFLYYDFRHKGKIRASNYHVMYCRLMAARMCFSTKLWETSIGSKFWSNIFTTWTLVSPPNLLFTSSLAHHTPSPRPVCCPKDKPSPPYRSLGRQNNAPPSPSPNNPASRPDGARPLRTEWLAYKVCRGSMPGWVGGAGLQLGGGGRFLLVGRFFRGSNLCFEGGGKDKGMDDADP